MFSQNGWHSIYRAPIFASSALWRVLRPLWGRALIRHFCLGVVGMVCSVAPSVNGRPLETDDEAAQ
jgi:hypothetical protein